MSIHPIHTYPNPLPLERRGLTTLHYYYDWLLHSGGLGSSSSVLCWCAACRLVLITTTSGSADLCYSVSCRLGPECDSSRMLEAVLGYAVVAACGVSKVPQLRTVAATRTITGLSVASIMLEIYW